MTSAARFTTAPPAKARDDRAGLPGVWMFAGYGTHWAGMGRVLLRREAAFATEVDRLDPHFVEHLGWGLRAGLASDEPLTVARAQPLTFGVQLALAALWRAHGARPAAVLGHSMGEVAAAVVAGALSVSDGVRVISLRARLLAEAGPGAMAVVELAEEDFTEVAEELSSLHIAVIGGPRQLVVTGPADEVAEFADRVTALGGLAHTLTAEGAGHCPAVDPLLPRLFDGLDGLRPGEAVVPFYSTAAPDMPPGDPLDAHYWMANLRNTVRLSDAVHAAARDGHRFFLEISPHPVLGHPVTASLGNSGVRDPLVVASTIRGSDEAFHRNLAILHANGLPPAAAPALLDRLVTVAWTPAGTPVAAPPASTARPTCLLGGADDALLRAAVRHPAAPSTTRAIGSGRVPDDVLDTTTHLVFVVTPTRAEPDPHAAQRTAHGIADLVRSALSHSGPTHSGPTHSGSAAHGHRLWLVTRGAAGVRPGEPAHPDGAWVRGTVRCLALEQPRLRATWLDLDDDASADAHAATLWAELAADDPADEIAWRDGNRHTARLVSTPAAEPRTAQAVSAGAAYLVTGGLHGIGLELARWLAQRRAGRIVLVGRPGAAPENREILHDLRRSAVDLVEARADLTDPGKATHLVRAARAGGLRLAGIVHDAAVSHDRTADQIGACDLRKVWTPTVHGGWLLHRALVAAGAAPELDWWVSLSSTAALLGSPGRSACAGANAWLDAFASWQRAQGLPAWSVSWGPWTRTDGIAPIRPDEAVSTLDALLRREPAGVGVLPHDTPAAVPAFPTAWDPTLPTIC